MAQIIALDPIFERIPAQQKMYKEIIVMVHHYGGHRRSFIRHIEWLNELGYDVITFDLPINSIAGIVRSLPFGKNWNFGMRHVWADKIENVLGNLPEEKILFSFSISSISALMSISRRHAIDVKGWVCDGGPFTNVERGIFNLLLDDDLAPKALQKINNINVKKYMAKLYALAVCGTNFDADAKKYLSQLPKKFPVLSVRSVQDSLVEPEMIDHFFLNHLNKINFQQLTLYNANHLLGLKDEPDQYKNSVHKFISNLSTTI